MEKEFIILVMEVNILENWINNLPNEQGLLTWSNGSLYETNLKHIKLNNMNLDDNDSS